MRQTIFGLVDCRSFYVSVERVWDQTLRHKPVVVLGNNDSAIVALSDEAKAIGLRRATPVFEVRDLIEQHQVVCFSSNYTLYADFSERVRQSLFAFAAPPARLETYSIDEWWIDVGHVAAEVLTDYGRLIRATVLQLTGLPTGVSFASTKTLSKIAAEIIKHFPEYKGVLSLVTASAEEIDTFLACMSVQDVWGIGPRYAEFLMKKCGIYTAKQLKEADLAWVRKHLTVVGARTVLELRGIACIPLEIREKPKKHIASAKNFGRAIEDYEELCQAVAVYTARVAEKLRAQGSLAGSISVFITTNRFSKVGPHYTNTASRTIPIPSFFTPDLIGAALEALREIYQQGYRYSKAGVFLSQIRPREHLQLDLFHEQLLEQHAKKERLSSAIDAVNRALGQDTIFFGAMGRVRPWQMRQTRRSRRFTTRWEEILEVSAD